MENLELKKKTLTALQNGCKEMEKQLVEVKKKN